MNITQILQHVRAAQFARREPPPNELTTKTKPKALPKIELTDRGLKALRNGAPYLEPFDVMDTEVRGFGVRVLKTGEITSILSRRFPGSDGKPTRRAIGRYGELTLTAARDKARDWRELCRRGIDPAWQAERERKEAAEQRQAELEAARIRDANTFERALEAYIQHKAKLRSVRTIDMTLRREAEAWLTRPLQDIDPRTVKALALGIAARGAPEQGRVTLGMLKTFFTWAVDSGDYGLTVSPAANLKLDA